MDKLSDKTVVYIQKQDDILNKLAGWNENAITSYVNNLFEFEKIEVGYRTCCGTTDHTQKVYRIWCKVLKKIKGDGVEVNEEIQKHGNSYATIKGGFWNSTVYTLIV